MVKIGFALGSPVSSSAFHHCNHDASYLLLGSFLSKVLKMISFFLRQSVMVHSSGVGPPHFPSYGLPGDILQVGCCRNSPGRLQGQKHSFAFERRESTGCRVRDSSGMSEDGRNGCAEAIMV